MKRSFLISLAFLTMVFGMTTAMEGNVEAVVITDHCTVVGSGMLPNGDMFSGDVTPVEGVINGTWEVWVACENTITSCEEYDGALKGLCNAYCENMDCAGDDPNATERACERVRDNFLAKGGEQLPCEPCYNYFVGDATRMFCWRNGVVLGDFWGTGSYNGEPGYKYQVHVQDFGASGADFYQISIWKPDGTLEHAASDFLATGNLVVDP